MKEQINKINAQAKEEILSCKSIQDLTELKIKYLGKKGELTAILKGMKDLSPEERPMIGELVNNVRNELENKIKTKEEEFKEEELNKKLESEKIDISLPSRRSRTRN